MDSGVLAYVQRVLNDVVLERLLIERSLDELDKERMRQDPCLLYTSDAADEL